MEILLSKKMEVFVFILMVLVIRSIENVAGAINDFAFKEISKINQDGPYIGIVVPNDYELNPLLESSSFVPHHYFDFAGRHFRIGELEKKKVIVVMTGLGMLNAGVVTQLLITLFDIEGVLHYGIAGNLNSKFNVGDVAIPKYWAHTGQLHWQRFGDDNGNFTREFGFLKFSDYNTEHSQTVNNLLNKVWYQPERIFPVDGTPELWESAFWIPTDETYYKIAKKLKNFELNPCLNTTTTTTTCLPRTPIVARVKNGVSANVFVNNAAFRGHLRSKFNATPTDMESAAVALVCYQHKMPFIAFRALSDLAGGGSSTGEIFIHLKLVSRNAFDVLAKFISLL